MQIFFFSTTMALYSIPLDPMEHLLTCTLAPEATYQNPTRQDLLAIISVPWPAGVHTRASPDAESAIAGRTLFGWEQLGPVPTKPLSAFPGAGPLHCTQREVIVAPCCQIAHGGSVLVLVQEEEQDVEAEWGQLVE